MKVTKRQRRIAAQAQFKKPVTAFRQLDISLAEKIPRGMTRAFQNTRYTVMVFDHSPTTKGYATKVLVQKHDDTPILNHWSELYKIKNEIFGPETTAIEYYPPESELINDHNIYWLWIYPAGVLPLPW